MKPAILAGALALASVSGCAAITERTGLTADQQICIATSAAAIVQEPATRDLPMLEKIGAVAATCGIDLTAFMQGAIQTAILAADKAE